MSAFMTENMALIAAISVLLGREPDNYYKVEIIKNKKYRLKAVYSDRDGLPFLLSQVKIVWDDKEASLNDFMHSFSITRERIYDIMKGRRRITDERTEETTTD